MTRFRSILLMMLAALMLQTVMPTAFAADEEKESESDLLTIGSKAPDLDIEHWVSDGNGKFKPVTSFEPGKVYVVEFWATWCGPCVASMPHLAELQKTYADKGVQIVSISDEDLETVEGFLKRPVRGAPKVEESEDEDDAKDEDKDGEDKEEDADDKKPAKGTYGALTSVYCLTTDPDGSSNADYMEAAQQNGIPTSFVVGKDGLIEWIGHPMELDDVIAKVVDGTWNREEHQLMAAVEAAFQSQDSEKTVELLAEAKERFKDNPELMKKLEELEFISSAQQAFGMIQEGEIEEGLAKLDEVSSKGTPQQQLQITFAKCQLLLAAEAYEPLSKELTKLTEAEEVDPETLNQVSWSIYEAAKDNDDLPKDLVAAGVAAAERAAKGAPENGMIIDTLAHFVHLQGDLDRAIELQTKAVENTGDAPAEVVSTMKSFLKKLEKEKSKAEKGTAEKDKK